MVRFAEVHTTVRPRVADALKVDELVQLDGFSAALVLPATDLYDDIRQNNLCRAYRAARTSREC